MGSAWLQLIEKQFPSLKESLWTPAIWVRPWPCLCVQVRVCVSRTLLTAEGSGAAMFGAWLSSGSTQTVCAAKQVPPSRHLPSAGTELEDVDTFPLGSASLWNVSPSTFKMFVLRAVVVYGSS